ncbi:hypothetical protein AB0I98_47250 [Streptomyces sp. NPDC050211]|uniref:hypothetical protein n=1 Tax=Streptomyces sp. NPDC050211 TaxID=3154932 RepID=UPI00342FEBA7
MRSRILAFALTATALAGFGVVNAPTASAAGKIEVVYSPPEISESADRITWHWTLTNTGDEDVDKVVLTHKITPTLHVSAADAPCAPTGDSIPCAYGSMAAGEQREGTLVADLPSDISGTAQINGRVTWEAPATTS